MRVHYCQFECARDSNVSYRERDLLSASGGQLVKIHSWRNFHALRVKQVREKSLVVFTIRVTSHHRNTEWHIRKIHASDEFKELRVGIHCVHLQLLNDLGLFADQIELGTLCCAGKQRCLKRSRNSRNRL